MSEDKYDLRQLHAIHELAMLGMYSRRKREIVKTAYDLGINIRQISMHIGCARTHVYWILEHYNEPEAK